ncbi:hypothetical protein [Emcibacter sp. SYSU 3D8]|uniref:terminase small subunit-like protein n=1 Tax=Emcibacter sp. SYSU 3D8 TaxID=3133969 RepID=UPI0031FEB870
MNTDLSPATESGSAMARLEAVGVDALLTEWAGGLTFQQLADAHHVGKSSIQRFLNSPENKERFAEAKRLRAAALADECQAIADAEDKDSYVDDGTTRPNTVKVQRDKLRIETRKWYAGMLDPANFGERGGPSINISIGQAHLDVMKSMKRADDGRQ